MSCVICTAGGYFDYCNPDQKISLFGTLHAVAREQRNGGHHNRVSYSVLDHTLDGYKVLKAWGADPYFRAAFLGHDLHEGYIKDIPQPLKQYLGEDFETIILQLKFELDTKIFTQFFDANEIVWQIYQSPTIKIFDENCFRSEWEQIGFSLPCEPEDYELTGEILKEHDAKSRYPDDAIAEFMEYYEETMKEIRTLEAENAASERAVMETQRTDIVGLL